VLSGDDPLTFPIMAMGGNGVISVASNVDPLSVSSMVHYALMGRWEEARKEHFKLLPLYNGLFIETNPIPVKTALRMMGKPAGPFRLPLCDMDPANQEVLRKMLADLGLI
jgi:4-hydroxy-tetrahydrodipicolinate synthase